MNPSNKEIKVPRNINRHIKDMIDPIVVRRAAIAKVAVAVVALLVAGFTVWQFLFTPPSGQELLAQVVEAAGGMENWYQIEEGRYTRVRTVFNEDGQPIREQPTTYYFRKGSDYRLVLETVTDEGPIQIGFDGNEYWATGNDQTIDPKEIARKQGYMCESDRCTPLCSAEMSFYRFSIPFKLTDPGVHPQYIGSSILNGVPVSLLEITYDPDVGRDRWVLFVDKESKFIHKIEHYSRADGSVPPEEIYWSDHRKAAGITFSHKNTYYRSNGKKLEEYTITEVDFESPVPENKFQKPGV